MKSHKYWSLGSPYHHDRAFYTGRKKHENRTQVFLHALLLPPNFCFFFSGKKMVGGENSKKTCFLSRIINNIIVFLVAQNNSTDCVALKINP